MTVIWENRREVSRSFLTFEQGTDFSPAGDSSLAGVLTQGDLQEEDGNAAGEEEDQVRD